MKSILLFLCMSPAFSAEMLALKDFLKSELSSVPKLAKENFILTNEQKAKVKEIAPQAEDSEFTFYYGKSNEGKIEKACVVVPQQGKEGPMTLGICYNPNSTVSSVVVLSAVEERGQKALDEKYLRQYKGKKVSDAFQIGKDVDAISGATWTSKAIAEALRKASFGFETFVKNKL